MSVMLMLSPEKIKSYLFIYLFIHLLLRPFPFVPSVSYSVKKGNDTDGTPISITCGAIFYLYDILSRTGNHTD